MECSSATPGERDGEDLRAQRESARSAGERGVVVVDDDEDTRELLFDILQLAGYRVHTAASAPEAIDLMSRLPEPPLLAIVDLAMPGTSGFEMIRQMRSTPALSPIAILVLTGMIGQRGAAMALGVEGWLNKPPTMEELLGTVDDLTRRA